MRAFPTTIISQCSRDRFASRIRSLYLERQNVDSLGVTTRNGKNCTFRKNFRYKPRDLAVGNPEERERDSGMMALARADGSFGNLLARLSRIDVLVIDDWAMAPLSEPERRDLWEICEDRYQVRSVILTSQLPVSRWHEQIGDPTVADGILDRLVHNAHRIELRGDSMRKNRGKPSG